MATKSKTYRATDTFLELVREFSLAPIRDDAHADAAGRVIDRLLTRRLDAGEAGYLATLSELVHAYESAHRPMPDATGPAVVRHLMEAKGWTRAELARQTGIAASTVSAILNQQRPLTLPHIGKLAAAFGVAAAVFLPRVGSA